MRQKRKRKSTHRKPKAIKAYEDPEVSLDRLVGECNNIPELKNYAKNMYWGHMVVGTIMLAILLTVPSIFVISLVVGIMLNDWT